MKNKLLQGIFLTISILITPSLMFANLTQAEQSNLASQANESSKYFTNKFCANNPEIMWTELPKMTDGYYVASGKLMCTLKSGFTAEQLRKEAETIASRLKPITTALGCSPSYEITPQGSDVMIVASNKCPAKIDLKATAEKVKAVLRR